MIQKPNLLHLHISRGSDVQANFSSRGLILDRTSPIVQYISTGTVSQSTPDHLRSYVLFQNAFHAPVHLFYTSSKPTVRC